jgi:hypothetical protein
MSRFILILLGIVCAVISSLFIVTGFPLLTKTQPITQTQLTESCVIRQFTGYDSGVIYPEYHLFLSQKEIDDFIVKRENELKHSLPITDTPKISLNEICLFIFMGRYSEAVFFVDATEEQGKIVFRTYIDAGGQSLDIVDSEGKVIAHEGPNFGGKAHGKTSFGYFILPKTNKKIVIQRNNALYKGEEDWLTVKEFNPE